MQDIIILVICLLGILSLLTIVWMLTGKVKEKDDGLAIFDGEEMEEEEGDDRVVHGGPRRRKAKLTKEQKKEIRKKWAEEKVPPTASQVETDQDEGIDDSYDIAKKSSSQILTEDIIKMFYRSGVSADKRNYSIAEFETFIHEESRRGKKVCSRCISLYFLRNLLRLHFQVLHISRLSSQLGVPEDLCVKYILALCESGSIDGKLCNNILYLLDKSVAENAAITQISLRDGRVLLFSNISNSGLS